METPALEFYDTVGVQSAITDQQLFKLLDQEGQTLVLRPDMTGPIARVAASKLHERRSSARVGYAANVFRAQEREGGRPAEFEQVGVELIGDGSTSADAEVIALVIFSLKNAGLTSFKISIGHVGILDALFVEVLGNEERAHVLRRYLYEKNYVGYREHVKCLNLSSIDKSRLLELLELRGGIETCSRAASIVDSRRRKTCGFRIEALWETLGDYGCTDDIKLDLGMVSHMSYYTGILFEVYAENMLGLRSEMAADMISFLARFDHPHRLPVSDIRSDSLLEALKRQKKQEKTMSSFQYRTEKRGNQICRRRTEKRQKDRPAGLSGNRRYRSNDKVIFRNVTYFIGARKEEKMGKELTIAMPKGRIFEEAARCF